MSVYLRQIRQQDEHIVTICDQEILGQCFEEGEKRLDVNEHFYKGRLVSVEESLEVLEQATIANLVGERIVAGALKAQLIQEGGIIRIKNIPHAQIVVTK